MIYTPSDPLLFVVVKVLLDFDIYSSFPLKKKEKKEGNQTYGNILSKIFDFPKIYSFGLRTRSSCCMSWRQYLNRLYCIFAESHWGIANRRRCKQSRSFLLLLLIRNLILQEAVTLSTYYLILFVAQAFSHLSLTFLFHTDYNSVSSNQSGHRHRFCSMVYAVKTLRELLQFKWK